MIEVDQVYCIHDYWFDYARQNKVKINDLELTDKEKDTIRSGEIVAKKHGISHTQYYHPILHKDVSEIMADIEKPEHNTEWSKEFPTEEGKYWFYGYRYGKVSCGHPCEPELMYVEVNKCANGFIYVASGQFMFESEVEEPHFQKVILPEFPIMED